MTIQTVERMDVPMPAWGGDYLEALDNAQGSHPVAIKVDDKSYHQIYRERRNCEQFALAVEEIRARWDSYHLALLEDVSLREALKPKNFHERQFRMKKFDPRYRDRGSQPNIGGLTIIFGFTMTGKKTMLEEIQMEKKEDSKMSTADFHEMMEG